MSKTRDLVKLAVDYSEGGAIAAARLLGLTKYRFPRNSYIRKTGGKSALEYYYSGIRTYLPIVTMAHAHGIELNDPVHVLDFGAGVGRQLLHFTKYFPNGHYSACDVDADAIAYLKQTFLSVDAYVSNFNPPLKYSSGSIDLVYTVSTFSHFSPSDHLPWLQEFARILRPGGLAMITTEGETAMRVDREQFTEEFRAELAQNGVAYREYAWLGNARAKQPLAGVANSAKGLTGSYGATLVARGYMEGLAQKAGFDIAAFASGVIDHRQDLFVLRRREG